MRHGPCGYITVEMNPGSDVRDCISEAVQVSKNIGCGVQFNFNGVKVLAGTDTDEPALYDRIMQSMSSKAGYKLAAAWKQTS